MAATLATFAGSGWFLYEIVHFILVDHYGLPDVLKDVTIVSVLGAMFSVLTLRWFKGARTSRRPRWERILVPILVAGTAAVDIGLLVRHAGRRTDPYDDALKEPVWTNSVAVLPLLNLSTDSGQEAFCDGLTEELISKLSRVRGLKVAARTSAFALKGDRRDVREIGRMLGVEKVLEGSVRKDASSLRISVQLINAADGFHVWSKDYDRSLENVFELQDEIARSVAAALKMAILEAPPSRSQTKDLEAFNEYLEGLHDYVTPTQVNLENAIRHFRRAVELDPGYARAWASLAAALAFHGNLGFSATAASRAEAMAAVQRALDLDESFAFAHVVRGWILMTFDWNWAGADASFAEALRLEPSRGYYGASQLALALGRFDRALALARKAAELDVLSVAAQTNLALAAFYAGRLDEAEAVFERTIRLDPEQANVHSLLAQVLLAKSMPGKALEALEAEKEPFFRLPVQAMAFHALGRKAEANEAMARFIGEYADGGAYQIAQVRAYRGDNDRAIEWLEAAYRKRDGGLFLIRADPYFAGLRSDPRFVALMRKVGFPTRPPEGA